MVNYIRLDKSEDCDLRLSKPRRLAIISGERVLKKQLQRESIL